MRISHPYERRSPKPTQSESTSGPAEQRNRTAQKTPARTLGHSTPESVHTVHTLKGNKVLSH